MPKSLSRWQQRKAMRKARKKIYEEEYQKAKAKALAKARTRGREQIREIARQKAQKYNVTARERSEARKKKFKELSKQLQTGSGGIGYNLMDFNVDYLMPSANTKHKHKKKNKRSNDFFSMDNNFGLFD